MLTQSSPIQRQEFDMVVVHLWTMWQGKAIRFGPNAVMDWQR